MQIQFILKVKLLNQLNCRYLVQIYSNLISENHLKNFKKMADAIRSLYLMRNQFHLQETEFL